MISSLNNAQVKNIMQLQSKSKYRKQQQSYVVEGVKMFMELPDDRHISTYVSESFYKECSGDIKYKIESRRFECIEDKIFKEIADTQTPQGILALVSMPEYQLDDIIQADNPLILILETLQDPGNLGTILRTAEGAGVSGIVMNRSCVDIFNPKVIRSTMGSIYRMPFVYVGELSEAVMQVKQQKITLYAAHLDGEAYYYQQDYRTPCGFFIGNEANGLSGELTALADYKIKIPMSGRVESLNAGVAAAIFAYEAKRQRMTGIV